MSDRPDKFPEGDPVEVRPPQSLAERQAGLNGPSGSPTSPSGRDRPDIDLLADRPRRALELLAAGPDGDLGRGALADLDELVALARENMSKESGRALIEDAQRWERAYRETRDEFTRLGEEKSDFQRRSYEAEARVAELEAALRDLLDNIGGHEHWDSTGMHGAGCETCIQQRAAKERARAVLAGDGGGA